MFDAMSGGGSAGRPDAVHGRVRHQGQPGTRQRRITDMLNLADDPFLVLADVTFDEYGSVGRTVRADFAQVNLGSVLFAVADTVAEPRPSCAPQGRAAGDHLDPAVQGHRQIHLLAERSLRDALTELTGSFLPVTEATYWSDSLGEAARDRRRWSRSTGRSPRSWRPHQEVDPWAGLDPLAAGEGPPRRRRGAVGLGAVIGLARGRHPRPPVRHPHGPRATRPGPRWIARPSPSDRPAGRAGCPTPPSRRRRPRRRRGRAASARTRASPPRPPSRRSRPSAGRG